LGDDFADGVKSGMVVLIVGRQWDAAGFLASNLNL